MCVGGEGCIQSNVILEQPNSVYVHAYHFVSLDDRRLTRSSSRNYIVKNINDHRVVRLKLT